MKVEEAKSQDRDRRFQDCIKAAHNSRVNPYTVPKDHLVAVSTNPDLDQWGSAGLGLDHSLSDDPTFQSIDWTQIGEYDDGWDLMSWGSVFLNHTDRFGDAGPGLNAYHLDRMGWLPRPRILTFGADGSKSRTVTLAALNHPSTSGYLLVRIPFDPSDLFTTTHLSSAVMTVGMLAFPAALSLSMK